MINNKRFVLKSKTNKIMKFSTKYLNNKNNDKLIKEEKSQNFLDEKLVNL